MILDKITLHNFGLYKGRQSVDLTPPSSKKPVVLFGGQNGAGKTTFLDALLLVLYGSLARCSNRGTQAYDKFLLSCINKDVPPKDGASLELQFRHKLNGSEATYNLRRSWSQNRKGVKEHLEVHRNGCIDNVLSDEWNNYVEEFMPSRIANLFFFDGEKIEEFADISNSSELLSTAIHSLLGVDIIDKLSNDLVVLKRRKKETVKNQKAQEEINEFEVELDNLNGLKSDIKQNIASITTQIGILRKDKEKLEVIIREEGGDLFEQRADLEKSKEDAKLRIQIIGDELRVVASGPAPLLLIPELINKILEQDIAERHAIEADSFLGLLEERDALIIKKMKSSRASAKVLDEISSYLSHDRNSRGDNKATEAYLDISTDCKNKANALQNGLSDEIRSKVDSATNEFQKLYDLVDDIDRKLASVPDKETIYEKIKERQEIQFKIDKAEYEDKLLRDKLKKLDWEIEQKSRRLVRKIESS
ncbi:MAG TPA: DNA sulfur modification protein DndD, partial [candidate division CPR3 bacterium]|nr:DNA sulfur modification protein DndD [candidate division CPR3 bacterium]